MSALTASRRGGCVAAGIALVVRLSFAAWAAPRFPAAGDGFYYDTLARRLAEGHGYTWLWPDGAVTSVAHYPVGYPAMLAVAYLVLGARPLSAMVVNALFGAAMALGVYQLVARALTPQPPLPQGERGSRMLFPPLSAVAMRRGAGGEGSRGHAAMASALVVALHPALVPYTAAVMTEGVAAALVVIAVAVARGEYERAWVGWVLAGIALGVATLVRPQCLAFAPLLGLIAPLSPAAWLTRARSAVVVTAVALAACAPWTARNCVAMHECALVSVNGGWNLLIGTQTTHGAWQPVGVPDECSAVWDEAAKDECFRHAARAAILRAPLAWLARAPAKLAATFDYFGAGPWYLHEANPRAFDDRAKLTLGIAETVASSALLLFALAGVAFMEGPRRPLRLALALGGTVLAAAVLHPWVAYVSLGATILAFGPRWLARAPILVPWTAIVVLVTAATHAVFFGAGRYGLVVVPFVTALALGALRRPASGEAETAQPSALREPVEGARSAGPTSRRRSPVFTGRREESPSSTECDAR